MPFLTFLLSNWKLIGIILLMGGAFSYVGTIKLQRDHARTSLAECRKAAEGLEAKIAAQNAAVQALSDESKRKTAEAAKKLSGARQATASAVSEAQRLRRLATQPAPSGANVACPAGEAVKNIRIGLK